MRVITNFKTTISASITSSQTTIPVSSIVTTDGHTITIADLDALNFMALEPGSAKMELISFTGITDNGDGTGTLTGVTRGLAFYGSSTAAVTANQYSHQSGVTITLSNVHYDYDELMDLSSDETVTGLKTFPNGANTPRLGSSYVAPTVATQIASKGYADAVATGGATFNSEVLTGTAGETIVAGNFIYFKTADERWWKTTSAAAATAQGVIIGIAQTGASAAGAVNVLTHGLDATQTGLSAGSLYYLTTAGGISTTPGTFSRFAGLAVSATSFMFYPDNDITGVRQDNATLYAVDAVGTDAYAITLVPALKSYQDGATYYFKAGTANTGAATLAINALAAKAIRKQYNAALATGDILAGQIVQVTYDGSNDFFQLISPTAATSAYPFGGNGSDGALSISSGTTTLDLGGAAYFEKNYSSISITGTGALAFSNPHASGTVIVLKSQGGVTITSNSSSVIDASSMGANSAVNGNGLIIGTNKGVVGAASAISGVGGAAGISNLVNLSLLYGKAIKAFCGAGGGVGGAATGAGGAGGKGGGALYIECAGAYNFTTGTMKANGAVGTAGNDAVTGSGGGGGGAAGSILVVYGTLTANSGTYTLTGGDGGVGGKGTNNTTTSGAGGGGGSANALGGAGGNSGPSGVGANTNAAGGTGGTVGTDGTVGGTGGASCGGGGGGGAGGSQAAIANTFFS